MKLKIDTRDHYDDITSEVVEAKKEVTSLGTIYEYENQLGMSKIFVRKDKINIIRSGSVKSNQKFHLGEDTRFTYRTQYMVSNFTIKTHNIKVEKGEIVLTYSLYEYESFVNKIEVKIKEFNS